MNFALVIRRALTLATALVAANVTGFALGQHERAQPPEPVRVEGLHARVEIVRDRHGVPHVRAKNEMDAHFGLGFVHAQDRLWQMEFQAQGTDDMAAWRWDRVHHALFPHAPFDSNPQLKPVFSRSIPNGGDKFTVNVASIFLWEDYNQSHAAMYRQVVDFGDLENSRFIVAPGQSGDPESPHYDDLLGRWQRVKYLPMRFDRKPFDGAAGERLVLEP